MSAQLKLGRKSPQPGYKASYKSEPSLGALNHSSKDPKRHETAAIRPANSPTTRYMWHCSRRQEIETIDLFGALVEPAYVSFVCSNKPRSRWAI